MRRDALPLILFFIFFFSVFLFFCFLFFCSPSFFMKRVNLLLYLFNLTCFMGFLNFFQSIVFLFMCFISIVFKNRNVYIPHMCIYDITQIKLFHV